MSEIELNTFEGLKEFLARHGIAMVMEDRLTQLQTKLDRAIEALEVALFALQDCAANDSWVAHKYRLELENTKQTLTEIKDKQDGRYY